MKDALQLCSKDRAYLAHKLIINLDTIEQLEIENLWIDEAIRRDKELDKGKASAHPATEVLTRARSRKK